MEFADSVCLGGHLYGKDRHAEILCLVSRGNASKIKKAVYANSKLVCGPGKVPFNKIHGKPVYSGRNWRMRGEDTGGPHSLQGLVKGEVFVLYQLEKPLNGHEGRVAFVHVADRRNFAQGSKEPYSAPAKDYLLLKPCFNASAIEVGGNLPVAFGV